MKAALVTPCLPHMPFHPSLLLGYGAKILTKRYDVEVIDLNAELHFKNREKLRPILNIIDRERVVSDDLHLYPFYQEFGTQVDNHYATIPWEKYQIVYITPPSWFPMVTAEDILKLSRTIKQMSPRSKIFFFGNSLSSWTNESVLKENGIKTAHLNDLFSIDASAKPLRYDLLPPPVFSSRDNYLFDLLPFTLKHGCSWGQCLFCSLSKGWNSGYLERSAKAVIKELEVLVEHFNPKVLVCRDHSLNGHNLIDSCGYLKEFKKPWCGQSRADLSDKKIRALSKAGCRGIYFGLESGSDKTLRAMNKGISSKQMSAFIKRLHSNGIMPVPSLIVGTPGEGSADFEKTIQFILDHRQYLEVVNVYPFMATPASEFSFQKKFPSKNTALRLFRVIQTCKDLGMKVILGEQSIEYFLFNRMCNGRLAFY